MTSRSKSSVRSYETEIEKSREESNWKKAVELAQQLKARSPQHESLSHFLIGEGKLEAFLDEWPPIKENIERAQRELSEARGYLTLATDDSGKKAGVALDAHLLLGKLHYASGAYDEALKHYKQAELSTLTEKDLPIRSLRIVAESYAIKGLCLEQSAVPISSSRYKQAERESEMIRSFELSSDLTLLYLQRTAATSVRAGPALDAALQRVATLHVRAGRLHEAVNRYRGMLSAVECQWTVALRLTLARQLAELLMRSVCGQVYKPPEQPAASLAQQGTLTRRRDEYASEGPWKPKRYAAINQFIPNNYYEEILLLLLVGEAMAVRDAVLSQSAEFEAARAQSLQHAVCVMDLLALLAARWRQHSLILESLERAMKFSFESCHVWRQRALATAAVTSQHRYPCVTNTVPPRSSSYNAGVRAHAVMEHAKELAPDDAALRLVGANTCYSMGWIEEGLKLAEEALSIEEKSEGFMLARCYLYAGVGYQMTAQKTNSRLDKAEANQTCLRLLLKSVQRDDNDHLAFYYLALQYLHLRMHAEAMSAARQALECRSSCAGALRLVAVLWSCSGADCGKALQTAQLAREHYPGAEWPLWALASLQSTAPDSGEAALATGKQLLQLLNGDVEPEQHNGYAELDARSVSQRTEALSGKDNHVVSNTWGERALSSGGDSSQSSPRARTPLATHRAQAWLLLAELYLRVGRVSAAAGCVSEAAALTPYSHLVLYTRGLVHAASAEHEEARQCFQNAIAIHPTHLDSIVHLGSTYYSLGWLRLSEQLFRSAIALEPAVGDTWRRLALSLAALGEHSAAADAAAAAIALINSEPLLRCDAQLEL